AKMQAFNRVKGAPDEALPVTRRPVGVGRAPTELFILSISRAPLGAGKVALFRAWHYFKVLSWISFSAV
ncbi:MAG TPA: hypothetical protein VFW73_10995, partial [Lacipirellulaceae bacterium]|nr:hypothetical protein [Lacipirellulaceae bacterium]